MENKTVEKRATRLNALETEITNSKIRRRATGYERNIHREYSKMREKKVPTAIVECHVSTEKAVLC